MGGAVGVESVVNGKSHTDEPARFQVVQHGVDVNDFRPKEGNLVMLFSLEDLVNG